LFSFNPCTSHPRNGIIKKFLSVRSLQQITYTQVLNRIKTEQEIEKFRKLQEKIEDLVREKHSAETDYGEIPEEFKGFGSTALSIMTMQKGDNPPAKFETNMHMVNMTSFPPENVYKNNSYFVASNLKKIQYFVNIWKMQSLN
jgi:hypothetical protein